MKYGIESLEIIDGQNPEYADVGNPYGYRYAIVWFAVATDPAGQVFAYRTRGNEHDAIADAVFLEENGFVPETFHRNVYGSPAYVNEELYETYREREDELFI